MKVRSILLSLIAVGGLMVFSATTANAQFGAAIVTENNNCLIPDGDRIIRVFPCKFGGARYNIYDGRIKTADDYCFDHGVPKGANPSNNDERSIRLVRCHRGKSQQWYFIQSGRGKGLAQNAANPEMCMNIEGGNDSQGARLIVWPCGYNNPARNERFLVGERVSLSVVAQVLSPSAINTLRNGGSLSYMGGWRRLIGADGATMVAAGAGNLIGPDGATMVAAGAGNMVAAGAGNIIGNDSGSLRRFLGQ